MFGMGKKKKLFTGLQPSGALHLGNYLGVLKPFADIYRDYESHIMVADLHALTTVRDPKALRQNIVDVVKDYIALGIDPTEAVIFKQSDVPAHTELAWMFECLVTVPFLSQAHAYKDKVAKGLEANAGLFNYPMLMASDILLYDTEVVPVGEDQRQHVEYAREAVTKFNNAYGDVFTAPTEMILKGVGIVPGTDGQKMSKSYKNTIPLFGTKDELAKAVMGIVTDSKTDAEGESQEVNFAQNVYAIHSLVTEKEKQALLVKFYLENRNSYKNLKEALVADLERFLAPMREKRESVSDKEVASVLKDGAVRAREKAEKKMEVVRKAVGISL